MAILLFCAPCSTLILRNFKWLKSQGYMVTHTVAYSTYFFVQLFALITEIDEKKKNYRESLHCCISCDFTSLVTDVADSWYVIKALPTVGNRWLVTVTVKSKKNLGWKKWLDSIYMNETSPRTVVSLEFSNSVPYSVF